MLQGQIEVPFDWKKELFARLDSLSRHAGTVAENVWAALVRQQQIQIAIDLLYIVVWITLFSVLHHWGNKQRAKDPQWFKKLASPYTQDDDGGWPQFFFTATEVVAFIGIAWCAIASGDDLGRLLNPQYYAFKDLLDLVRGATVPK